MATNKLKTKRLEMNMSQLDLAKASGVKLKTIRDYEQGVRDLKKAQVGIVFALACALECRIEDLINTEDIIDFKEE